MGIFPEMRQSHEPDDNHSDAGSASQELLHCPHQASVQRHAIPEAADLLVFPCSNL